MSLLGTQSEVSQTAYFWAPASGGGGGAVGPNLTVSTLTTPASGYVSTGVVNVSSVVLSPNVSTTGLAGLMTTYSLSSVSVNVTGGIEAKSIAGPGGLNSILINGPTSAGIVKIFGPANISTLVVSSLNGVPAITQAQWNALSTLTA